MSISSSAPWLNYYGNMPRHLEYPSLTMYQLVARTAGRDPLLPAYEFLGKSTTYAAFLARVERAAKALYALGIRKGDRVTLCLPNMPQALECFYALNRIGAVSNMIHPLSAEKEIESYLNVSESKAILTLDRFYGRVAAAANKAVHRPLILIARMQDEMNAVQKIGYHLTDGRKARKSDKNCLFWVELLKHAEGTLPPDDGKDSDCACILYSGGTSGTTKGICLSNLNFNALALQTIAASGQKSIRGCSMLSVMPLFHGFGLGIGIHTALVGGAKCILVPRFSISTYAELLKKKRPNFIPGVPTLFEALLRTKGLDRLDMSFLMGVFSGGDTLPVELKHKVDAFLKAHHAGIQIREGYGTTECVTASCLTPPDCFRDGSIGIPFPNTFYKIVRVGSCEELEAGQEGEICISGPTVMLGYLNGPAETALALRRHADGRLWLHTGDLGKMDADGFLYFSQRIKRIIVTSGYNVYPGQIESILNSHEKVALSCVIGVRDPYRMQRVKACIVLRPDVSPSDDVRNEILTYCRERIVRYAVPAEIEFRDSLPKTSVGKIAYHILEKEAEDSKQ